MRALVIADRCDDHFGRSRLKTWTAMLPVAGKPVIQYSLEMLAAGNMREAVVVAPDVIGHIQDVIGTSSYSGMRIAYEECDRGQDPDILLPLLCASWRRPFLVVRGDMLRSDILGLFLNHAITDTVCNSYAISVARSLGIAYVNNMRQSIGLGWNRARTEMTSSEGNPVELGQASFSYLSSFDSYLAAELGISNSSYQGLLPQPEPALIGARTPG